MNNTIFLKLINEATDREITEKDLNKTFNELSLDSLDVMTISLAVEGEISKKITSENLEDINKLSDFKKFF